MHQEIYYLPDTLTVDTAADIYQSVIQRMAVLQKGDTLILDFSNVRRLDSIGVVTLETVHRKCNAQGVETEKINLHGSVAKTYTLFTNRAREHAPVPKSYSVFESIGGFTYWVWIQVRDFTLLLSNIYFWGVVAIFKRGLMRKGEVIRQSNFIGANAVPIVSLVAFLIGFILALQSANQLRPFGADIFVAQLVAIAMIGEMGPLITAIIVAGRSGSSFTAEIGAMVVTEEIDALKSMGVDPIPYLVVPKLFAIVVTLPMLTMLANFIGIFGGAVIGMTYMQLELIPFYNEVISVLRYKEIITSLVKSVVFAVLILVTGVYFGLHVEGGPEGVGRATTRSVVISILLVIIADSLLGLFFYFE
jgi:phospholipid/cholesterol/gamma-HCH transport system permease protein